MAVVAGGPRLPSRASLAAVAMLVLAGCGPVAAPPGAAEPAPAPRPAPLDAASLAAADTDRGELLSLACQACHTFRPGESHNIGPNLYGIFGQRSAGRAGFTYSEALLAADIVWTPAALDRWLSDPAGYVAGSTMTFAGYASPQDRRDLIAFLLAELGAPAGAGGAGTTGGEPMPP